MLANGYSIGGEQSGHHPAEPPTGDGMMSAIALLGVVAESEKAAEQARRAPFRNIRRCWSMSSWTAKKADNALADENLAKLTQEIETKPGKNGRVLIRASVRSRSCTSRSKGRTSSRFSTSALAGAHHRA